MTQVGQTVKRDTTRCGIRSKWGPQYWTNGHFRRQGSRIRIFRLFRILHLVAKSVHVRAALEGKMTTAELTSAPPSKNDIELARNSGRTLARLARRDVPLTMRVRDAGQEETLELPAGAVKLLMAILEDMAAGRTVTLVPRNAELTTQEAADFLNVSRPFFVQLLEKKQIPFRLVGSHRRVRFEDVLRYKEDIDLQRRKTLDELTAQAQELEMGY